jgi:DNA-binding transcriptional LysR family regulator
MEVNPPRRRLPPLNALRSFESAARHGSFLKAARELNVTPGAVSRLVKSLEEYLKVGLFGRTRRGIVLTEEGREFANAIGQSLDLLSRATERLLQGYRESTLRICCYPTFAAHWLIPRWVALQNAFADAGTDAQIDLRTTLTPELEDPNAFDFIARIGHNQEPVEEDGIRSERILDIETFPICSPDFFARHNRAISLEDLDDLPIIHAASRPYDWDRWRVSAGGAPLHSQRAVSFESIALAYNAALSGAGIAIGVKAFVTPDIEAGRLVRPFTYMRRSTRGVNTYYNAERIRRLPKVRRVLEWMLRECEKDREASELGRPKV